MDSEKIKFGKMLQLIVATEFPRSRHMSFAIIATVPFLVFIAVPVKLSIGEIYLSPYLGSFSFVIVLIISHFTLRKYSKKWQKENKHALKKHSKKILHHLLLYMMIYWGSAIALLFTLANLEK